MVQIHSPSRPADQPYRLLDCQQAIELAFQDLVEKAARQGWSEEEILDALMELAEYRLLYGRADAP